MAVDDFFKLNTKMEWDREPETVNSMYAVMDYDDFNEMYGIDWDEFTVPEKIKKQAYVEMNRNRDNLNILFDCGHGGKKHRHHVDYARPLDVELLCLSCHGKRHAKRELRWKPCRSEIHGQRNERTHSATSVPESSPLGAVCDPIMPGWVQ